MPCFFSLSDIIDRIKNNSCKKKCTIIERKTADVLKKLEYRNIPYKELWRSAIRCKLVYDHHSNINGLWRFIKTNQKPLQIDDAYVYELSHVSEPIHYDTRSYDALQKYNTTSFLWHTDNTIYITFHVEKHIEKKFLKKQDVFIKIRNNISVNSFFYYEILSLLKHIRCYIEKISETNPLCKYRIVIAGYSLGGIIVQIIAPVLAEIFKPKDFSICCHTFGSPKAGDSEFVKWFTKNVNEHYRIINGNDPITMFPINHRWRHILNTTLQFDMDLHINIIKEDTSLYKNIWFKSRIINEIIKEYRDDHSFDLYITRLWKYARIAQFIETSAKIIEVL